MNATILDAEYCLLDPRSPTISKNTAIAVQGGRIAQVGHRDMVLKAWPSANVVSLPKALLMPGLINAHQHGRGLSQVQLGFMDNYLEAWMAARKARSSIDRRAVTQLVAARMLAHGVTATVHANYTYGTGNYEQEVLDQLAAYDEVGIRATLCVGAMDRGSTVYPPYEACFMDGLPPSIQQWMAQSKLEPYVGDAAATIAFMHRLLDRYQDHATIRLCYGPAGPQWVSDELWEQIARDAREHDLGIHTHFLESPAQKSTLQKMHPEGVLKHLESLGAITAKTVLAHAVWPDDSDIDVLTRTRAIIVANPGCNMRMRNGIAPYGRYVAEGVRVAVGTDNCSLNDDEDLLSELRLVWNLARTPNWSDSAAPTESDMLSMATINAAAAAQYEGEIGILEPGMRADIAAFNLERVAQPYLDEDMALGYAFLTRARGADACMTMVEGKLLYLHGEYQNLDIALLENQAAQAALSARLPSNPEDRENTRIYVRSLSEHYKGITKEE